jgi:hypothetical protein
MLYGNINIRVGTFHELAPREIRQCPSYYAADWEVLRTTAGDYPLNLAVVGGYTIPMPQWAMVGIDAVRIAGQEFSGFGGVNFASKELPKIATTYSLQLRAYGLSELVSGGKVTLAPEFGILRNPNRREVLDWFGRFSFKELRERSESAYAVGV